MNSPFIFFDLDNTLYPASSGVLQEMNRRIGVFCSDYFGINEDDANTMRRGKHALFGTTLQWLRVCHGLLDPEHVDELPLRDLRKRHVRRGNEESLTQADAQVARRVLV